MKSCVSECGIFSIELSLNGCRAVLTTCHTAVISHIEMTALVAVLTLVVSSGAIKLSYWTERETIQASKGNMLKDNIETFTIIVLLLFHLL